MDGGPSAPGGPGDDRCHRPSRARRQRHLGRCRGRASRSATAGSPSSICRRPATSRWPRPTAGCVISFNGEIYNFAELRAELEAARHRLPRPFRYRGAARRRARLGDRGDAEARSTACSRSRCGTGSSATLTLARDRLGKKPLYYGWFDGSLLFGSELKALLPHPAFSWEIDRDALGLLIQYAWLPSPYSIFQNVRKLPPASFSRSPQPTTPDDATPVAYWSARLAAEAGRRAAVRRVRSKRRPTGSRRCWATRCAAG